MKGPGKNNKGQGLVEYVLIVVLISISAMLALSLLGIRISDVFCEISEISGNGSACMKSFFSDAFDADLSAWEIVRGKWQIEDGKLVTKARAKVKFSQMLMQKIM